MLWVVSIQSPAELSAISMSFELYRACKICPSELSISTLKIGSATLMPILPEVLSLVRVPIDVMLDCDALDKVPAMLVALIDAPTIAPATLSDVRVPIDVMLGCAAV